MAKQQWKVFFEGDFWYHSGRDHAGKELRTEKKFEWAGHEWRIPAVYCCGKGLAVDFCMRAGRAALRTFMDKWKLPGNPAPELPKEGRMRLERDNPLTLGFRPHIFCNGKELTLSKRCSVSFQPYLEEIQDMREAKAAMEHYGLSDDCGWTVTRAFFKWDTKRRPEIRELALRMEQIPVSVPGERFTANKTGDCVRIIHPKSRESYTLIVREYARRELEEQYAERDGWEYPRHFDVMGYTVEPEAGKITLEDCFDGDPARKKPAEKEDPFKPAAICSRACIALSEAGDAVFTGENGALRLNRVCSSVRFAPVLQVEWLPVFHIREFEDHAENLIETAIFPPPPFSTKISVPVC